MRVDWKEYYREFSRVHGGNPVLYKDNPEFSGSGYLLFPDGWTYARADPSGPEYPPPDDPKKHLDLICFYWNSRRSIIEVEYAKLRDDIESLMRAQAKRSASLQVPSRKENEEGLFVTEFKSVDFDELTNRLQALSDEIDHCRKMTTNVTIPRTDEFDILEVVYRLEEIDRGRAKT